MESKEFSKDDSLIIKGLAILTIMLHNLFRWVEPITGENEFGFSPHVVQTLYESLTSQPQEFINVIFNYLGHFGVQAFILLSGYGLTKSMLSKPKCWTAFMGSRLKKIYPLLIIAVASYSLFRWGFGDETLTHSYCREIIHKLLLIHTLMPYEGITFCGPWWFFGLITQLYVLFPILLNLTQRYGTKILVGTAVASYVWIFAAISFYDHEPATILVMQNAPGHLPEFCLGIWLALRRNVVISRWWLVPALAMLTLGNFSEYLYPFTFLAASIIILTCYNIISQFIANRKALKMPLIFIGSISMFAFAFHGLLRQPFIDFAEIHGNAAISLLTALVYVASVIAVSLIVKPLYNIIIRLLDKIHFPKIVLKADKIFMAATLILLAAISVFHATSLIQNHLSFDKTCFTDKYSFKTNSDIYPDTLYSDILHIHLGRCGLIKLTIDAEIDTQKTDNDSIPLLVTEIEDLYWDNICMPQTEGFEKVHFEKNIYGSFFDHRKKKYIKLYFWNRRGTTMKFRNAEVKIDYQKW